MDFKQGMKRERVMDGAVSLQKMVLWPVRDEMYQKKNNRDAADKNGAGNDSRETAKYTAYSNWDVKWCDV